MKNVRTTAVYFAIILGCASALPVMAGFPGRNDSDDNAGLQINQTEPAEFPNTALMDGIHTGKVRLIVSVDAEGRLVDHLVVAYTNKVFVGSAVRAVKAWTYEPARVRGRARASRVDLVFAFKADLVVMVQNSAQNFMKDIFAERYEFSPSLLRDLDHIPTPVHVVSPTIPNGLLAEGEERVVTVEFYIDQEGKVRIPAVSREDADDRMAAVAVTAVEQWRFEPPVRKGAPVLVLAQQDFHFMAKPKAK